MSLRYQNRGKKWTVQEEDIILSMFHNHTIEDISKVLKRPPHTVVDKMQKMGISVKKEGNHYFQKNKR